MGTQEAINNIIRLVGGQGNINKVWHCMTRLRFDLIDDNKVDQTAIKKSAGGAGRAAAERSVSGDHWAEGEQLVRANA